MINQKIKIALLGYGAMGREIEKISEANGAVITDIFDIDSPISETGNYNFDVAIDFTHPGAVLENIQKLTKLNKPMVIGTTGWYENLSEVEKLIQEKNGKLIYASNFSVGVQLLFKIIRNASALFNNQEMYDIAINEIHHVRKVDSPSGTAISLANIVLDEVNRKSETLYETSHQKIDSNQLHVTSSRLGDTPGTHTVSYDCSADTIEITHRARNRSGFAIGSIIASKWILNQGKSGVYLFDDIL
ncbi:MAG: 4-hydroxy-tetrahydrodipicolinate reductase [Chlorobiota bacterium]|nr:4-hydroxy-tetrahydrodipicolinate reductase [Chlorobiota bacterium]QQS66843.1 MAG: 4-hydroxy-tetrahydrodipicolinate reductase [Chlorobiota bacterium]